MCEENTFLNVDAIQLSKRNLMGPAGISAQQQMQSTQQQMEMDIIFITS